MEDEKVLRIAERRQTADQIRGHDLQDHRVFDIEVHEGAGDDRERIMMNSVTSLVTSEERTPLSITSARARTRVE
jgi:hypothetical protein